MKNVLMIVYTDYHFDARVRREAETLARTNKFRVSIIVPKNGERPRVFDIDGVRLIEVNEKKYNGKNKFWYSYSYLKFLMLCFFKCTWFFFRGQVDIVHVHNMPDILVFAAAVPRLFGRKVVLDIHDSMPETYLAKYSGDASLPFKLLCLEESASAAMAHRIICVNHVQKEVLVGRGIPSDKITILMNVPDPVLFPSCDTTLRLHQPTTPFGWFITGPLPKGSGSI